MSQHDQYDEQESWGPEGDEQEGKPGRNIGKYTAYRYIRLKKGDKGTKLAAYNVGDLVIMGKGGVTEGTLDLPSSIVPIQIRKGRVLQTAFNKNKPTAPRKVYCRSNDRLFPILDNPELNPKSDDCASCSLGEAAWNDYMASGETKQDRDASLKPRNCCEKNAELVFADFSKADTFYVLQFEGANTWMVEELERKLRAQSKDDAGELGRRPALFEYVVTLDTAANRGGFWNPTFDIQGRMDESEVPLFQKLFREHKANQDRPKGQQNEGDGQDSAGIDEIARQEEERIQAQRPVQNVQQPQRRQGQPQRQQPVQQAPVQQQQRPQSNAVRQQPTQQVANPPARRGEVIPPARQGQTVQQRQPHTVQQTATQLPPQRRPAPGQVRPQYQPPADEQYEDNGGWGEGEEPIEP
jgi:hypothetical protein